MHFPDIYYKDGKYYAYYISYNNTSGVPSTGLATSTNGFDWEYEGQVINPEEPWELSICAFAGIWEDEDGIMYIVYEAGSADSPGKVGLAVSFDGGKTWKKEGGILYKDQYPAWCQMNIGTPDIYKKDGVWYVTFHGWGNATKGNNGGCEIGVAFGDNLRKLDTLIQDPIVPTEKDTAWSGTTGRRDVFYCDGYYYIICLFAAPYHRWVPYIARSRDLRDFEMGTVNPIMWPDYNDKTVIHPERFTKEELDYIENAVDCNNSDIDMCEINGKTLITYSWGNQLGKEFLALAEYDGTNEEFLKSFFQ
jgi:hypothetical protein